MKELKKCLLLLPLFALLPIGLSLLSSTDANAASPWDNVIDTTNNLVLKTNDSYCTNKDTLDIKNSIYEILSSNETKGTFIQDNPDGKQWALFRDINQNTQNPDPNEFTEARGAWANKEHWGITRLRTDNYGQSNGVTLWWTEDTTSASYFQDFNPYFYAFSLSNEDKPIYHMNLTIDTGNPQGTPQCSIRATIVHDEYATSILRTNGYTSGGNDPYTQLFYWNWDIQYPDGYEGINPPQGGVIVPTYNDAKPVLEVNPNEAFEKTVLVSDKNFFTFDGVPFTCGEFVPQMTIQIFKETDGEQFIDGRVQSSSSQFSFNLSNYINDTTEPTTFRAVGFYSCPEYNFDQVTFYDFTVDRDGNIGGVGSTSPLDKFVQNIPTHGLQDVILAPLEFLKDIPETGCSALVLPLPNGIGNINMPCMTPIYQQYFGQIFIIYQTILTGLFAYYVAIKSFGNIKEITNPRDDSIETVKL